MRKLKLSLKKEIISDLEAKDVKGGYVTQFACDSEPGCDTITVYTNCNMNTCTNCLITKVEQCETKPINSCDCLPTYIC